MRYFNINSENRNFDTIIYLQGMHKNSHRKLNSITKCAWAYIIDRKDKDRVIPKQGHGENGESGYKMNLEALKKSMEYLIRNQLNQTHLLFVSDYQPFTTALVSLKSDVNINKRKYSFEWKKIKSLLVKFPNSEVLFLKKDDKYLESVFPEYYSKLSEVKNKIHNELGDR